MLTEVGSKDNIRIVKESILGFVTTHFPNADPDSVDDVIVSYVFAAIDAVDSAPEDFCVHVDELVDIISAYIEEFNKIDRNEVYIWIMDVVARLAEEKQKLRNNEAAKVDDNAAKMDFSFHIPNDYPSKSSSNSSSRSNSTSEDDLKYRVSGGHKIPTRKQIRDFEEALEATKKQVGLFTDVEAYHFAAIVNFLADMFPDAPLLEVRHCVTIASGDVESALATLLHRREHGLALSPGSLPARNTRMITVDTAEIKSRIINRYSYVDRESETKEHKPLAPKHAPKKMVRYRDNKIVSLKGERYTEVSKGEEEGVKKSNKKNHP